VIGAFTVRNFTCLALCSALFGCAVEPEPLSPKKITERTQTDIKQIRATAFVPEGPLSLEQAIARALLRRPPVLIFDEPGQMLDERGDKAFIQAVKNLKGECTIILITHRPSHMRAADRLIALNNGQLIFDGDPEEALERMGGDGR
tara:strand:- start:10722 stop:11159 length:438 start_codon:yes stop_codon:yes gene_type:complete